MVVLVELCCKCCVIIIPIVGQSLLDLVHHFCDLSSENTNYFFDVRSENLPGALDRFAQFFLCPLFTPSATDREVNAVNSENDKNLQQDPWRFNMLDFTDMFT